VKRILLTIFLSLVLVGPGFADIGETEWGMTKEQVKKIEKGEFEEGVHDGLPYLSYGDSESTKTFGFDQEGRLYQIEHRITPKQSDKLGSYRKVRKLLIGEYGEPNLEIVTGAKSRIEWARGGTTIRLSVRFSDPSFSVVYFNPPMHEEVSRLRLLLLLNELEKERLEKTRSKGLEIISITSE